MDARLTDADLIQLVQEKLPEELTHAEIRQLHERLKKSNELKAVLIGQLHMESYLTSALSEIDVSVDEIVRRALVLEQTKQASRWPLWTGLAGVLLLLGVGIYFATRPASIPDQLAGDPTEKLPEEDQNLPGSSTADVDQVPVKPLADPNTKKVPVPPEEKDPENVAQAVPEQPLGKPTDPWFEALNPETPLLALAETAYELPNFEHGEMLKKAEASRWLEAAAGQSFQINDKTNDKYQWVELNGVGKLKAPWVPSAVLRLSLFDTDMFRLHFWAGEVGVTLWHYPQHHPNMWVAYQSRRKGKHPVPEQITSLLTSDDGRQARVRSGLMEIRYQEGQLVVSQDQVPLLRVPLQDFSGEVVFEGKCMLSEIRMYRGEDFPPPEPNPRPLVVDSTSPTGFAWMTLLPGRDMREGIRELGQASQSKAQWQEMLDDDVLATAQDGKLQLSVQKSEQPVHIGTVLRRPGLYEMIFRVEDPSVGTGVYFGDAQGNELLHLGFLEETTTKQIVFDATTNHQKLTSITKEHQRHPAGYVGDSHWFRIVWGFGSLKVWSSADGVNWGIAASPVRSLPGIVSCVGLVVQKTEEPRKITLAHLEIREMSAITSLASATARDQVPSVGNLAGTDFGTWNQNVIESWPGETDENPKIEMADWRRAWAIRSLADSPWSPLSATLLRGLIEEGLEMPRSLNERFRLLDEVSLLYDLWGVNDAAAMVKVYERLGSIAATEGHRHAFGLTLDHLRRSPILTDGNLKAISPEFNREMLLHYAFVRDWEGLRAVARRTEFLMLDSHPQRIWWWEKDQRELLVWAESLAQEHAPEKRAHPANFVPRVVRGRLWQHPLVTQLSKEGYNVMAEFEAALTSDAFEDACRIITSAGRAGMAGLLPDSKDPDLLVSLPRAIAIAMREYPELQTTMRDQFGEAGRVRVREAMTRADIEAVEAATVQFYGTEAAAEAHRWLGDRALASGKFAQAAQAYQEGLPFAENSLARELRNRLRLAAGMLGHDVEPLESESVQIASTNWTGSQFDQLMQAIRQKRPPMQSATLADWAPNQLANETAPPPARIQAVDRNQLAGDLGKGVGRYEDRNTDWVARQLSAVIDGDFLYASNRFQVVCYQLSDGKTKWARGLGEEQGEVHHWPMVAMQPIIVGDRLFVRRLTKRGPELACLDKTKGDVLWHVRPEHHVASDPVFVQNRLLALVATFPQSGMLQLDLTSFHPDTGDVLSQVSLLHLRDEWAGHPPCQIVATGGKILCLIGGTTLCSDPSGQPQWLQQHPWVPASVDRYAKLQHHQPPIVFENRVYAAQSGVKEAACFDLGTGRKFWSQPVPDLIRLVGLAGDCLVVQTELGLTGFDRVTGKQQWEHAAADILYGAISGEKHLLYSRVLDTSSDGNVCLVWLNPRTGEEISHAVLDSIPGDSARFGPMVMGKSRLWAFRGEGFKEAQRTLVELVPEPKELPAGPLHPNPLALWVDDILPRSLSNTAKVLPGWMLTSSQDFSGSDKGVQWLSEFRGERGVAKTRMENQRPVHLVGEIKLPIDAPQTLNLRVGHESGQSWTLKVNMGNQQLLDQPIDDKTAPNGWWNHRLDLEPWKGKTIWLSVSQTSQAEKPGAAFWKQLDVEPKNSD